MEETTRKKIQNTMLALVFATMIYSVFAGFYIQSYDWMFVMAGGIILWLYCAFMERTKWTIFLSIPIFIVFGIIKRVAFINGFYTISNKMIDMLNQNTGLGFYYYVPVRLEQSRMDCFLAGCFILLCACFLIALFRNHLLFLFLFTGILESFLALIVPYSITSPFFFFLGIWFACYSFKKQRYYFGGIFFVIFAVASSALFLYDQSALQHVTECKKNAWIVMKKLMQGKENNTSGVGGIGNGEIGKINVLSLTGKHLFSITTESKKTLYLREYISSDYRNGRWENTQKETNLCKGEVSAALPFAFSELGFQKKNFSRQREVTIEYPQKKDTYGYLPVPYFADLNNVAGIVSGDGSVVLEKGRLEYRVQYYEVKNLQRLLKANGKIKQKVKKSIEEGSPKDYYLKAMKEYNTYVKEHNLFIPKNIQKELEKEIQTSLNGKTLEQKIDWVKKYIKTHYHYTYQPGGTPKGMDSILYFYEKSKKGFCTQYASLTVMMLRMAGVPARYVEGYKISENEFQGTRADVTDYNVHAWAEIYLENTGWIPIDTTGNDTGKKFYHKIQKRNQRKEVLSRKKQIVINVKKFVTIMLILFLGFSIWIFTKMLQKKQQWKRMSNREKILWYAQKIEKQLQKNHENVGSVEIFVSKVIDKARYSPHEMTKQEVFAVKRYLDLLKKKS